MSLRYFISWKNVMFILSISDSKTAYDYIFIAFLVVHKFGIQILLKELTRPSL